MQYFPQWLWYAVFCVCLASGLGAICYGSRGRVWLQVVLGLIYLPLMATCLFLVQVAVGCGHGDCL